MPTTIPGQGVALPGPQFQFGYPNGNDLQQQHARSGQAPMLIVGGAPVRDATSTALVQPTPYGTPMMPMMVAQPVYAPPQLSRRTKLVMAGAGLTLFVMIATIAIIKGSSGGAKAQAKQAGDSASKAVVEPIERPDNKTEPPKTEPVKAVPTTVVAPKDPPRVATVEPPKKDPPAKKDPPKNDPAPKRVAVVDPPKKDPAPKRVGMGLDGIKDKAAEQYRNKNFTGAAATLKAAVGGQSDDDAKMLRNQAAIYSELGKAYNTGMAPATPPKEAFEKLRAARSLDNSAGKELLGDIDGKLAQVAPKAALSFMAGGDFEKARDAVRLAETVGANNSNTKAVRGGLEQQAATLYKQASSEISADPEGAKQKLRQIQRIVESKSQWYQKASKLLSGG
jgi:hypothetical protein